jgi:hypothetical protein
MRKLLGDGAKCGGIVRRDIGEPFAEALLGIGGGEQLRSADELRGQRELALACCG